MPRHHPNAEDARAAPGKIAAGEGFFLAGRLPLLLRDMVETALSRETGRLKESAPGIVFLGPVAHFLFRLASLVRIHRRRLRVRMAEFDEARGASGVCMAVPTACFTPVFEFALADGRGFGEDSGRQETPADSGRQPPLKPMPRGWKLAGILLLLAATGIGLGWWQTQSMRRLREAPAATIAVLTFENANGSAEADPLCEQIAEELSARLSLIPGLGVIDRQRLSAFGSKGPSLDELAAVLDASMLVEGSVRRQGERLRVTARLVAVRDGAIVWAGSYERRAAEASAVLEDIADSVARALRVPSFTPRATPAAAQPLP